MANYAYIRTATNSENHEVENQIKLFSNLKIDKFFKDIGVSGLALEKPELNGLLSVVTEGDSVYIRDLSRLSRSNSEAYQLLKSLHNKGINVFSFKNGIEQSLHDKFERLLKVGFYSRYSYPI